MEFAFDLISDLHVNTWPKFDWTGIATSPVAIVAGNIACDRNKSCQNHQRIYLR